MSIKVEDLKKLSESECYIRKSYSGVAEKIILFLKENQGDAYTQPEIVEWLNGHTNQEIKLRKSSLYNALSNLKKQGTIQKRGSYYYYENGQSPKPELPLGSRKPRGHYKKRVKAIEA